jgi:hypothetical protein
MPESTETINRLILFLPKVNPSEKKKLTINSQFLLTVIHLLIKTIHTEKKVCVIHTTDFLFKFKVKPSSVKQITARVMGCDKYVKPTGNHPFPSNYHQA